MNTIKKYWWVLLLIVIGVLIIVVPLVINWLILQPQRFDFIGDGTHWLGFWATYISAIASFAMVFITWKTLRQMKHQWEVENRPYLYAEIMIFHQTTVAKPNIIRYVLIVENCGNHIANDVKIKFDDNFLQGINHAEIKSNFEKLITKPFSVKPKNKKHLYLCDKYVPITKKIDTDDYKEYQKSLEYLEQSTIDLSIEFNKKYKEETSIDMENVNWMNTSITQMLDYIRKSIDDLNPKTNK